MTDNLWGLVQGLREGKSCHPENAEVVAVPTHFESPHRIGLANDGTVALLLHSRRAEGHLAGPPLHLRNLVVRYQTLCLVSDPEGNVSKSRFSIVRCLSEEPAIIRLFLRIFEERLTDLGDKPNLTRIQELVGGLVTLFSALGRDGTKGLRGLWAELFIILESDTVDSLVDRWHVDSRDRFDFFNHPYALQIKATAGPERTHHFILQQLRPDDHLQNFLASIIVPTSQDGSSPLELMEQIEEGLSTQAHRDKLRSLARTIGGSALLDADVRFDAAQARSSLRIFDCATIPAPDPDVPARVSDVRFIVDLGGLEPTHSLIDVVGAIK